ncbi:MAG TPA: hypothetical protein VFP50_18190 [Anaeromyxobacteraceae bacterium]|nr:hypothetical protein [Anaeromyxobacteraceae bacterium]
MAYVSQTFGQPGDDRKKAQAGTAGPDAAPSVAGAPSAEPLAIDRNPVQSFFAANRDQGAKVLSGLADSLGQKMQSAQVGFAPTYVAPVFDPGYKDGLLRAGGTVTDLNPTIDKSKADHAASLQQSQAAAAQNTAGLKPIQDQVGQLRSQEGQQALLSQGAGADYSRGQGLLDSWLGYSAIPQNQATVDRVQSGLGALQNNAAIVDPLNQKKMSLEDYLNGRS